MTDKPSVLVQFCDAISSETAQEFYAFLGCLACVAITVLPLSWRLEAASPHDPAPKPPAVHGHSHIFGHR